MGRTWYDPPAEDSYANTEGTKKIAKKVKDDGIENFILDIQYSPEWADPGEQTRPHAWDDLTFEELKFAVYNYTKDLVQQLVDQDTTPAVVQVGNEITNGLL